MFVRLAFEFIANVVSHMCPITLSILETQVAFHYNQPTCSRYWHALTTDIIAIIEFENAICTIYRKLK